MAAGLPECPALLFDRIKGYAPGFRVFTNATTSPQRAALALGLDPALRPLDALKAWMAKRQTLKLQAPVVVKDAPVLENSESGTKVDLATLPAPYWHAQGRRPLYRHRLDRHHARSRWRLDQRLDLPRAGPRQDQGHDPVRSPGPPRRHHRQEILGPGQALPGRRGQRRGPGAVHRRLRVSAGRLVGVRLRRRHQGRAGRGVRRADDGSAAARARRDHPRRRSLAGRVRRRCRKDRSGSSPATTPPTSGPARSWR